MKNSDLGVKNEIYAQCTRYVYLVHLVQFEIWGRLCMKIDVLGLMRCGDKGKELKWSLAHALRVANFVRVLN